MLDWPTSSPHITNMFGLSAAQASDAASENAETEATRASVPMDGRPNFQLIDFPPNRCQRVANLKQFSLSPVVVHWRLGRKYLPPVLFHIDDEPVFFSRIR